ncbi:hypothetical protein JCM1840_004619 [Sporobolomyces johnsonii]
MAHPSPLEFAQHGPPTSITDPLFLQGLASILAPYYARNASPDEITQVTKRAEAFYLSSQAPEDAQEPAPLEALTSVSPIHSHPPSASFSAAETAAAAAAPADDPPYPLTFAHLAHLIATGAPIPGIKDIPDRLAEGEPSESRREVVEGVRKPWEVRRDELGREEREKGTGGDGAMAAPERAEEGSGQV